MYVEIIQGYVVLGIEKNVVCHISRVLSPLEISGSHCDCTLELSGEHYKLLMLYPNFAAQWKFCWLALTPSYSDLICMGCNLVSGILKCAQVILMFRNCMERVFFCCFFFLNRKLGGS